MVPNNEHDFSEYSWSQAIIGVAKLAVLMSLGFSFLMIVIIWMSGMFATEGDERYQQELRVWCNGRHPELTFDDCVDLEGL